jgi:hypothetical protein
VTLSMPILLALGGALIFLIRTAEMRITHAIVGILLGAQLSATALSGGMGAALSAADHLLRTVFP